MSEAETDRPVRVTIEAEGMCCEFFIRDVTAAVLEWPRDVTGGEDGRKELGSTCHLKIEADVPVADFTGWWHDDDRG
jgi:hypothetical protein